MELKELVDRLVRLGFSGYEARAYITLLKNYPVTGYELAKSSGIPPSKIYEVISKLLARSIISPLSGKPVKYIPQNSRVFFKNLRVNFQETISYLEKNLPALTDASIDYVWNVNDMNDFLGRAKDMIATAKKEIVLMGWDSEITQLLDVLKKSRLKKIAIIQYGSAHIPVGAVYNHGIEEVLEREKGGRQFSLATDKSSLLQGLISARGTFRGVYTSHASLVEMAVDHMRHEIYTTKMYDAFAQQMDDHFGGKELKRLRNIWEK